MSCCCKGVLDLSFGLVCGKRCEHASVWTQPGVWSQMHGQGNRLFKWYLSLVGCVLVAQFAVVIRPMPVKCLVAAKLLGHQPVLDFSLG